MEYTLSSVKECALFLKNAGFQNPVAGIVLGTGLGALLSEIEIKISVSYNDIPNFPEATVEFHKGNLIFGWLKGKPVVYARPVSLLLEVNIMQQITLLIRVMKELGIQYLLLSNAAGGMNPAYKKGDLVLIEDHINLLPENPLRGLNAPEFGNRFVDMSQPYNQQLNTKFMVAAAELNINLKKGIYVSVMGPNLETRAEYRHLRLIGADMVGMSTVPEVIVANHIGLPCAAVSVITDECDPDNLQPVNISEIIAVAGKADVVLSKLFNAVIEKL